MSDARVVFDFACSMGVLTVEADRRNGHPRCVLRADGSELSAAAFGNALGSLTGLRQRYLDAFQCALDGNKGEFNG